MKRRIGLALALCLCATILAVHGCSRPSGVEAAVDKAVSQAEVRKEGAISEESIGLILQQYEPDEIVPVLRNFYSCASSPSRKAAIVRTARLVAHRRPISERASQDLCGLAEEWLFNGDSPVARISILLLSDLRHPDLPNLIERRLRTACEPDLLTTMLLHLTSADGFGVIRAELTLPYPHTPDPVAVRNWHNHAEAALIACRASVAEGKRVPSDFGAAIVALALKDDSLTNEVLWTLLEILPDNLSALLEQAQTSTQVEFSRLPWEAASIAVDDGGRVSPAAALLKLKEAASGYRNGNECWSELVLRTQWLAFAAVYGKNADLLARLWASLEVLHTRDRAQLLSVIAREFSTHNSSRRTSTSRFLLFLGNLPGQQLHEMVCLCPGLGFEIRALAESYSTCYTLPERVSHVEITRIVASLRALLNDIEYGAPAPLP